MKKKMMTLLIVASAGSIEIYRINIINTDIHIVLEIGSG